MTAYINIGSNLGDRMAAVSRAVELIKDRIGADVRISRPYESLAWGYESAHIFLNVGLMLDTALPPRLLLDMLLEVEREISAASHRTLDGGYCDRVIDIDLIAVDSIVVDTPALVLPHPRMHLRDFVLYPLMELDPLWRHPLTGHTAAEMIERLTAV